MQACLQEGSSARGLGGCVAVPSCKLTNERWGSHKRPTSAHEGLDLGGKPAAKAGRNMKVETAASWIDRPSRPRDRWDEPGRPQPRENRRNGPTAPDWMEEAGSHPLRPSIAMCFQRRHIPINRYVMLFTSLSRGRAPPCPRRYCAQISELAPGAFSEGALMHLNLNLVLA
jgi:hypothetical protein